METAPLVTLLTPAGSAAELFEPAACMLQQLGATHVVQVYDAHGSNSLPEQAAGAERKGTSLLIVFGKPAQLRELAAVAIPLPILTVPLADPPQSNLETLQAAMPTSERPIGSLALGRAGAVNAALLAVGVLGRRHPQLADALGGFRAEQTRKVLDHPDPRQAP